MTSNEYSVKVFRAEHRGSVCWRMCLRLWPVWCTCDRDASEYVLLGYIIDKLRGLDSNEYSVISILGRARAKLLFGVVAGVVHMWISHHEL